MTETLIIFSRYPEPGKTKTRMIPALGAEGAAELQRQMTEHMLTIAKKYKSFRNVSIEVHFAGGNGELMLEWLGNKTEYIPQVSGDLGHKMHLAFDRSFKLGNQRVVTIGIDCPDINQEILENAFNSLQKQDLVLGPAKDGGYYLIGLNQTLPQLFQNIDWGTEKVLNQTKYIAQQLNLSIHFLPTLSDVDLPQDLTIWQKYSNPIN
ncbi:TIGR04282 family arsenosugar biosynthesis glycosyltransferase [Pleurocapsa sp. PCC 7319]|uniref:TIGR04282 family arsenosugar biosynthesis glycosyltransferase n=1 Tax=Pleurocapsa sp. PCC 7319 TaxID=118161 RepID=UPI00034A2B0B|nr:TIGR04282 family arsenosugar biosynthesis glycosyltransferase [Pleurocapsa sp. PCC 7319]